MNNNVETNLIAVIMESVLKMASATSLNVFLMIEDNHGIRQITGSSHLKQVFKEGCLKPTGDEVEMILDQCHPTIYAKDKIDSHNDVSPRQSSHHLESGFTSPNKIEVDDFDENESDVADRRDSSQSCPPVDEDDSLDSALPCDEQETETTSPKEKHLPEAKRKKTKQKHNFCTLRCKRDDEDVSMPLESSKLNGFDIHEFLIENEKYKSVVGARDMGILEKGHIYNKIFGSLMYEFARKVVFYSPFCETKNAKNGEYFSQCWDIFWEHFPYLKELHRTNTFVSNVKGRKCLRAYFKGIMQSYYMVGMSKYVSTVTQQQHGGKGKKWVYDSSRS